MTQRSLAIISSPTRNRYNPYTFCCKSGSATPNTRCFHHCFNFDQQRV